MIKNEKDMFTVISLLIWKIETIDGNVGTASNVIEKMNVTRQQQLYSCVLMKYKIMKIRMKISFTAFEK